MKKPWSWRIFVVVPSAVLSTFDAMVAILTLGGRSTHLGMRYSIWSAVRWAKGREGYAVAVQERTWVEDE